MSKIDSNLAGISAASLLAIALVLATPGPNAEAGVLADFTVDTTGDGADPSVGDGTCDDGQGRCTLRAAIQEANALAGPQTIQLGTGTYQLTIPGAGEDLSVTGDLDVTDTLTVVGLGAAVTLIDANGALTLDRGFHIKDPAGLGLVATLQDLTIINGAVLNENGGGVLVEATEGGFAPDVEVSVQLVLIGAKVAGNFADSNQVDPITGQPVGGSGGGIYSAAALDLQTSEISGNTAAANGGGYYAGGVVASVGTLVTNNAAEGGGGVFETGSHISSYSRCAIVGNTAVGGGGVSSRAQTTLQFLNCTFDGNSATDVGGGIQTNGTVNLVYSTVTANDSDSDAPNGGAGLNSFGGGSFRLWSTLVADNRVAVTGTPVERNCGCTGGPCTVMVQFLSLGFNLEDLDTCWLTQPQDLPASEPLILPLSWASPLAPVRPLGVASPALEVGDPALCPATDQRGVLRPSDGDGDALAQCDIGAFEFDALIFTDGFESGGVTSWDLAGGLP
jgi:CSLREA domain-containing protein